MSIDMTALSINISEKLARESTKAAEELGISRTEFIRRAIKHEITNYKRYAEQEIIGETLCAMEEQRKYKIISEEIDDNLNSSPPDEEEEWWSR
jgi:metal-responsive CopG/Arc/MetJ family transcriptional regulator